MAAAPDAQIFRERNSHGLSNRYFLRSRCFGVSLQIQRLSLYFSLLTGKDEAETGSNLSAAATTYFRANGDFRRLANSPRNARSVTWGRRSRAAPETPQNLNAHCCNLGLSEQDEDDIVAFLRTLTDAYPSGAP
jgi:hypothetical protein